MPTTSRTRTKPSWWAGGALLVVSLLGGLGACGDDADSAGPDDGVDVADLAGDAVAGDDLVGTEVTVSGEVDQVLLADEAFVLSDVEGGVLVVFDDDTSVLGVVPSPGQAVEVRGTVVEYSLDLGLPSEPFQEVLREELYGPFVGERALVAEYVAFAPVEDAGAQED